MKRTVGLLAIGALVSACGDHEQPAAGATGNTAQTFGINDYTVSWIGNTWGIPDSTPSLTAPAGHVPADLAALAVDGYGGVFTNSEWDEGGCEAAFWTDSKRICLGNTHGAGGLAVAVSSSYVFLGQRLSQTSYGLTRRHRFTIPPSWGVVGAPWGTGTNFGTLGTSYLQISTTAQVAGLAWHAATDRLYVSNPSASEIRVYNATTMAPHSVPSVSASGSCLGGVNDGSVGPIAVDAAGMLWVIRRDQNGKAKSIDGFTPTACPSSWHRILAAPPTMNAAGIAFDHQGRLMVADTIQHQINLFRVNPLPIALVGSVGQSGGIYAGNDPGAVAYNKFSSPSSVGADSSGNVYVGSNLTSTDFRKLNSSGGLVWWRKAADFQDSPFGSGEATFYSHDSRYFLDYAKPIGQEWTQGGVSIHPNLYPNDPRLLDGRLRCTLAYKRVHDGRFLATVTENMSFLALFEMSGEIARPSAMFSFGNPPPRFPNQPVWPPISNWRWVDSNGDGDMQIGEYIDQDCPPAPSCNGENFGEITSGIDLDDNGNLWVVVKGAAPPHFIGIRLYRRLPTLDAHVNLVHELRATAPNFPTATLMGLTFPPFTAIRRTKYIVSQDRMYVSGYTADYPPPAFDFDQAGSVIARYDNFCGTTNLTSTTPCNISNAQLVWALSPPALPYSPTYDGITYQTDQQFRTWDVAGERLFVGMYVSHGAETTPPMVTESVRVYNTATAAFVGVLAPKPAVNNTMGWLDTNTSLHAFRRSNGEYVVTTQEQAGAKFLLYRGMMLP